MHMVWAYVGSIWYTWYRGRFYAATGVAESRPNRSGSFRFLIAWPAETLDFRQPSRGQGLVGDPQPNTLCNITSIQFQRACHTMPAN